MAVVTSLTDSQSSHQTTVSTITFTALGIGAAQASRIVFVNAGFQTTTGPFISSASIQGIAATMVSDGNSPNAATSDKWFYAAVPTGTTGDVIVNLSASTTIDISIVVYSVTGSSSNPVLSCASNKNAGGNTASLGSVVVKAGGAVIASGTGGETAGTVSSTWTTLNKDYDVSLSLTSTFPPLQEGRTTASLLTASDSSVSVSYTSSASGVVMTVLVLVPDVVTIPESMSTMIFQQNRMIVY